MRSNGTLIIFLLAALKFGLPFLLQHPVYELHRDEYLYYQQGLHLDWGYLENPPLIGLLAKISSLFGGGFFLIKFWPALFGAFTVFVTAAIVKELGGKQLAQVVAAMGIIFSAYLRINFLFQPNFLDIFFWTLSAFYLIRYINTQQPKFLYLLSITLVFGWWSKYSVLFFAAAIIISVLLTRHRKVMLNKHFGRAAALGVLLILPNLFWQYNHNWPLVHHMDELRATQLKYINKGDFVKEQVLMLFPVLFIWIGGLIWLLKHRTYRIIALVYVTVLIFLMLGSGKGYYALGAYPMLLAAGGVWIESISIKIRWLRFASVLLVLLLSLPFLPLLLPIQAPQRMAESNQKFGLEKIGLLKWEDHQNHPLQQDFADMLGWREMTQKSEAIFTRLPDTVKAATIVYCRSYGEAGAVKYYANTNDFRNKVICDNGTFLLWIPDHLLFKNLLFIGSEMPGKEDEVFQHFSKVAVMDSITNPLSRQFGDKIIFFQDADTVANRLATDGLREMKAVFGR